MSRGSKIGIVVGFLVLAVALGVVGVTLNNVNAELDSTRTTLRATSNTLAQEQAANAALQGENASLEGNLTQAIADNATLVQANAGLAQDKAVVEANLDDALDAIDEWSVAYETSQGELQASRTAFDALDAEHTALGAQHQTLTRVHQTLDQQHQSLTTEHRRLTDQYDALGLRYQSLTDEHSELAGQYDDLLGRAGTLDQLAEQVAALEAEIRELEEKRRPLLLSVDRQGFYCTGSMEPKITCLDEATWLENPMPEEITVGTVISFNPNCWEDEPDDTSTAHRVMDIKVENGVYYYWPQGDASDRPDGCWVPFDHVDGYIIEIHKDVNPENAELRNSVNEARASLEAALEELNRLRAEYRAIIDRYCGRGVNPANCQLASPEYEIAIRAFRAADSAYDDYEAAFNTWECWVESASNAIYRIGKPPLYVPCITVRVR